MISSNDCCTYRPVTQAHEVEVDDIVFCQVQPGGRFFAHKVARKYSANDKHGDKKVVFEISNNKGRVNGWCYMEHIYGKCVLVES